MIREFFGSRLFSIWLGIVGACLVLTIFIRLNVAEKIRSYFQDGEVQFLSTPPGAQILINGENEGTAPLTKTLTDGEHDVIFMRGNWQITQQFTVKVREKTQVSVNFNYASVDVTSERDNVQVSIDGIGKGTTPAHLSEIQPGAHTLAYSQGTRTMRESVTFKEGQVLVREISFGDSTSTIGDGATILALIYEPTAWIGMWQGEIPDHFARSNGTYSTSEETLKINPDLRTGIFYDRHKGATITVPVTVTADGSRLTAKGVTRVGPGGNYGFTVEMSLLRTSGEEEKITANIIRHYLAFNQEQDSSVSSGDMGKIPEH